MGCTVVRNRHGFLAYRLRWDGRESHEGVKLLDTPQNRGRLQKKADIMAAEMRAGVFDYVRWFPRGNKASLFAPAPAAERTVRSYALDTWLPRKMPPVVRKWARVTYQKHLNAHILPFCGDVPLAQVDAALLERMRGWIVVEKGRAMKTARDVIDGTFRALYRDARIVDKLVTDDPFGVLVWPRRIVAEADPFDADERDRMLGWFREKLRHYYPFVYVLFWTGMRTAEAIGLRWGDVNLRGAKIHIRRSRSLGEENAPKTAGSSRDVAIDDALVAVLREIQPLRPAPRDLVFRTKIGTPLVLDRFTEDHWHRALRATSVRARGPYHTRHTFISLAVSTAGVKLAWLAKHCGTSVAMIERHYGRYMHDDGAGQLGLMRGEGKDAGESENAIPPAAGRR